MTLKARLTQVERLFDAMRPKGRVHVVWPGDETPETGPDDTLIKIEYRDVESIEAETERQNRESSGMPPKRFQVR